MLQKIQSNIHSIVGYEYNSRRQKTIPYIKIYSYNLKTALKIFLKHAFYRYNITYEILSIKEYLDHTVYEILVKYSNHFGHCRYSLKPCSKQKFKLKFFYSYDYRGF